MANNKNKIQVSIIIILVIFLITSIVLAYVNAIGNPFSMNALSSEETPREALGTFGDYIGGVLNPFLAFASFIALLYTLKLNQEELNETRKELKRAADAQEDAQYLRNEQLKTQFLQQFDSFFSMLLNQLNYKLDDLKQDKILDQLHQNMEKELSKDEIWYVQELKNLFNFIYLTLDAVVTHIGADCNFNALEKSALKNKYWTIIRSIIPEKVMHLMMKDSIDDQVDPKVQYYRNLLEQSEFFQNLSFYGLNPNQKFWLLWASFKFNPQIFGNNYGFKQIKKTLAYQMIADVDIKDLESFVFRVLQDAGYVDQQRLNENTIPVVLNKDITFIFDYTNNPLNPHLYYVDLLLSEINLTDEAILLKFKHQNTLKNEAEICISLEHKNQKIQIKDFDLVLI